MQLKPRLLTPQLSNPWILHRRPTRDCMKSQIPPLLPVLPPTLPPLLPCVLPPLQPPLLQLSYWDDQSNRSSGHKQAWDQEDSAHLELSFGSFSSLLSTDIIRSAHCKDKKLWEIIHREGWKRTYTKIKNIFKKEKARK